MRMVIQQYRGLESDLQSQNPLLPGELYFCNDTHNVFIGTGEGNILLIKKKTLWKRILQWIKDVMSNIIKKIERCE